MLYIMNSFFTYYPGLSGSVFSVFVCLFFCVCHFHINNNEIWVFFHSFLYIFFKTYCLESYAVCIRNKESLSFSFFVLNMMLAEKFLLRLFILSFLGGIFYLIKNGFLFSESPCHQQWYPSLPYNVSNFMCCLSPSWDLSMYFKFEVV